MAEPRLLATPRRAPQPYYGRANLNLGANPFGNSWEQHHLRPAPKKLFKRTPVTAIFPNRYEGDPYRLPWIDPYQAPWLEPDTTPLPGAWPGEKKRRNTFAPEPISRKRIRAEFEEDLEAAVLEDRRAFKKVCIGIFVFADICHRPYPYVSVAAAASARIIRRQAPVIARHVAKVTATGVRVSANWVVRQVIDLRRAHRRFIRERFPPPPLRGTPFRRALIYREGLRLQEAPAFDFEFRDLGPESADWVIVYTEADAQREVNAQLKREIKALEADAQLKRELEIENKFASFSGIPGGPVRDYFRSQAEQAVPHHDRVTLASDQTSSDSSEPEVDTCTISKSATGIVYESRQSRRTGNLHLLQPPSRNPGHHRGPSAFNEDLSILSDIKEEDTIVRTQSSPSRAKKVLSTPIVEGEELRVRAGPTRRRLFDQTRAAEIERSRRMKSSKCDGDNPVLQANKVVKYKLRKATSRPVHETTDITPSSPEKMEVFTQLQPVGIAEPDSPSAYPDSPATQLLQELRLTTQDDGDSDTDISMTVQSAWVPPQRQKEPITPNVSSTEKKPTTEPTAAQPLTGENAEESSKPVAALSFKDENDTMRTPTSRRVHFKARLYADTPPSDISSTCNVSPGPTPKLEGPSSRILQSTEHPATPAQPETPASRRGQSSAKSHHDTKESDISSTCDVSPGPTPQLSTLKVLEEDISMQEVSIHDVSFISSPVPTTTPKASRHSAEKTGRVTRAQKRAQDFKDDTKKYTLTPLSDERLAAVDNAAHRGIDKIKLSAADVARVVPNEGAIGTNAWLNDESINAYLELVVALGKHNDRGEGPPSHHAFNSFFFKNLREKGSESVKRWAKKARLGGKDLLQTKYVFIPINSGAHWTLAVVSGVNKTITHYNSLPGSGGQYLRPIEGWVKSEVGSAWVEGEWTVAAGVSPQQNNSDDCGVFTVTNARQLMLGLPGSFSAGDIPLQRQRMVAELVEGRLLKGGE